jgi:alpha-beta hydrolase superfamily lysophospholipase
VNEPTVAKRESTTAEQRRIARAGAPSLAFRVVEPAGEPRGSVLIVHGYAEHIGRYGEVAAAWAAKGLLVGLFDLRGHGHSEGPRGHVDLFDDYVRDTEDVLARLSTDERWRNLGQPVLFGHSLGGLVSCHVVLRHPKRFAGLALSSPFLGVGVPVPPVQKILAPLVSRLLPRLRQPSGLKGDELTHDLELVGKYDSDPLGFRHITVRWFDEVTRAQELLMDAAPRIHLPVLCLAAGDDRVVSLAATERMFQRLGSERKELRVLDGCFHEILNEIDRSKHIVAFADQMLRWLT